MKNRNLAKVLALVLTLALLIGSVAAISVSAAGSDPIKAATIVHGAKIQIAVAVEAGATGTYYWEGAESEVKPLAAGDNVTVSGTSYATLVTEGVAYYELGKVAHITVGSETVTYSVAQFLYAMIYREQVTGNALECYESLLALGEASQKHLNKNTGALVTDSAYIYTNDDNILVNGSASFAFVPAGKTLVVTPAYVSNADSYTGFDINSAIVAKGNTFTVAPGTVYEVKSYSGVLPTYGMDFESSVTKGVHLATGSAVLQESFVLGETYTPATKSGAWGNIVEVTKTFEGGRTETSNVLKIVVNDGSTKNTSLNTLGGNVYFTPVKSSDDGGKIHVLEFDFNWAQAAKSGWRNPITLYAWDAQGNKLGNVVDAEEGAADENQYDVWTVNNSGAFTEGTVVENAYQMGISGSQSELANGNFSLLNSDTWYRLRYVWNQSNGKVNIAASNDGGETWYRVCSEQTRGIYADADYLTFSFDQFWGHGGIMYFDDMNYKVVTDMPDMPETNGITE